MFSRLKRYVQSALGYVQPAPMSDAEKQKLCELLIDFYLDEMWSALDRLTTRYADYVAGVHYFRKLTKTTYSRYPFQSVFESIGLVSPQADEPERNDDPVWRCIGQFVEARAVLLELYQIKDDLA